MSDILKAVMSLRSRGLRGTGVIGAYHVRRVASLMARALPLFGMGPIMELGGTVLPQGPLRNSEIAQCVKEATDTSDTMFPIQGHPVM